MRDKLSGFDLLHTFDVADAESHCLSWDPTGNLIASAFSDGNVHVWNKHTGERWELATNFGMPTALAWSPIQQEILVASASVRAINLRTGSMREFESGHSHSIWSMSMSGDRLLASASEDKTVRIWDLASGRVRTVLFGHLGPVTGLAWSSDNAALASSSEDGTIRLWDVKRSKCTRVLRQFGTRVLGVAWASHRPIIASCGEDRTIVIWNSITGHQEAILESHTKAVQTVTFSADASMIASASRDGQVFVWRTDTLQRIGQRRIAFRPQSLTVPFIRMAFHPTRSELAATDKNNRAISLFAIDRERLTNQSNQNAFFYRNAKVVLLGDSGVGKSCLGFSLVGKNWNSDPASSHGRRVWLFSSETVKTELTRSEHREVLLWDFAGQPDYRIIHQLHLYDVALAILLFDASRSNDPLSGIHHWIRALTQAEHVHGIGAVKARKILVAARTDVGQVHISDARIEAEREMLGVLAYYKTSAREGWGISDLKAAIAQTINWQELPGGSSTETFQKIKSYLLDQKNQGFVLFSSDDLYRSFGAVNPAFAGLPDSRAQFATCIRLLASRDLIEKLSFGDLVLLQPELIDIYAAAIVNTARGEPNGLGCVAEEKARQGDLLMPTELRAKELSTERLLLIATIEELIRHEIALREGNLLVLPSQLTREAPKLPLHLPGVVHYEFDGPLNNIYATLIIRLSHSDVFHRSEMWDRGALFKARGSGVCGLQMMEQAGGHGRVIVSFADDVLPQVRYQFDDYVHTHLKRHAIQESILRKRIFRCPHCKQELTSQQVGILRSRGAKDVACFACEESRISLLDWDEVSDEIHSASIVLRIDSVADAVRDKQAAHVSVLGKKELSEFDVFLCHNDRDKVRVRLIAKQLKKRGISPWLDELELRPGLPWMRKLQHDFDRIKAAAVFVSPNGVGPWQAEEVESLLNRLGKAGRPVIPVLLPPPREPKKVLGVGRSIGGRARMQLEAAMKVPDQQIPVLPLFMENRTWVDFNKTTPNPLERLIWGITGNQD